jgi:hypothetical protein
MSYKSDIVFLFSGGPANADPVKSLGGGVSSYEISPIINNLFKDGSEEEQNKGLIDYKCIYVYNSSQTNSFDSVRVFVDNVLDTPNQIDVGFILSNEKQKINLGGIPTSGSFEIQLENETTDPITYPGTAAGFATNIKNAINALSSGNYIVSVDGTQENSFQYYVITFLDPYGKRTQPIIKIINNTLKDAGLVSIGSQISISKLGSPINNLGQVIGSDKAKPANVEFKSTNANSTISIGNLKALDFFPIWIRRTIKSGVSPSILSGSTIKLIGTIVPKTNPTPLPIPNMTAVAAPNPANYGNTVVITVTVVP